jgi:hypothetical protein
LYEKFNKDYDSLTLIAHNGGYDMRFLQEFFDDSAAPDLRGKIWGKNMPARCAPCAIKKCIYWSAEINTKKNNQQESRNGAPVHQSAMLVALLVALWGMTDVGEIEQMSQQ